MNVPMMLYLALFQFLPMFGLIIAFKDFKYTKGILGSDWAGLKYFENFFSMPDIFKVIINSFKYGVLLAFTGMVAAIIVGLLLYEVISKKALKFYQTAYNLPNFISWVLVAYIGFTLFSAEHGVINQFLTLVGMKPINWYTQPQYWSVILMAFNIWKSVGVDSLFYYAALMGVDASLLEASELDGANYRQRVRYVLIPSILPVICMLLVLKMGSLMSGGYFGLFYQVPIDSKVLYSATDIIDTYIYRGLINGSISQATAVNMFQSVVSLVLVLSSNLIIKKISPENAVF